MWAIYSPRSKKNAIKVHKSTLVFSQTAQLLVGVLLTARKKKSAWRCGAGGRIQAQAVQGRIIQVFCFVPAEHNDR